MSKFSEAMKKDVSYLFVTYTRGATRDMDQYSYGIKGTMPIAHLVGYITRVQAELAFRDPDPCDECACVIIFNPATNNMSWFVDSSIPVDPLVGTLELIKASLIDSQMANMFQQKQTGLVDANNKPILRG